MISTTSNRKISQSAENVKPLISTPDTPTKRTSVLSTRSSPSSNSSSSFYYDEIEIDRKPRGINKSSTSSMSDVRGDGFLLTARKATVLHGVCMASMTGVGVYLLITLVRNLHELKRNPFTLDTTSTLPMILFGSLFGCSIVATLICALECFFPKVLRFWRWLSIIHVILGTASLTLAIIMRFTNPNSTVMGFHALIGAIVVTVINVCAMLVTWFSEEDEMYTSSKASLKKHATKKTSSMAAIVDHDEESKLSTGTPLTVASSRATSLLTKVSSMSTIPPKKTTSTFPVRALYSFTPGNRTELGFTKGELLTVVDYHGNWWRASKVPAQEADKDTTATPAASFIIGFIPSNYVEVLRKAKVIKSIHQLIEEINTITATETQSIHSTQAHQLISSRRNLFSRNTSHHGSTAHHIRTPSNYLSNVVPGQIVEVLDTNPVYIAEEELAMASSRSHHHGHTQSRASSSSDSDSEENEDLDNDEDDLQSTAVESLTGEDEERSEHVAPLPTKNNSIPSLFKVWIVRGVDAKIGPVPQACLEELIDSMQT